MNLSDERIPTVTDIENGFTYMIMPDQTKPTGYKPAKLNLFAKLALYVLSADNTAAKILEKLLTIDGTGSGLDADKLDGVEGDSYAPKASPTFTGIVTSPAFSGRKNPRVNTISTAGNLSVTPNIDLYDVIDITDLRGTLTFVNPTGTPANKMALMIDIMPDAISRTISFGTSYAAGGIALPATTTASKMMSMLFVYSNSKYKLRSLAQEA